MYQQRLSTASNKIQQKNLQDCDIKPIKNFTNNQEIKQVQQIYNLQQRNIRGLQIENEEKGIQIKVFQTSTKQHLDEKSTSQTRTEHSLQKRLFPGSDESFNQESVISPKHKGDTVSIRLFKPIDQKFRNFIREYGYIVGEYDNQSSFMSTTTERSRMPSNERQIVYSNSPPPQKSFRTKLFNHVN